MANVSYVSTREEVMIEMIEFCSIAHIRAATRFSRLCHEVEAEYNNNSKKYSELQNKLQEFAMASQ